MTAPFPHRHLLGIEGLSASDLLAILDAAEPWIAFNRGARKADKRLAGLTQINAFFENSTRTLFSFEIAGKRLGAQVSNFHPAASSVRKGESLRDTALTLNAMGGIGMLAVGILGSPFLGYMQESSTTQQLKVANPALYEQVTTTHKYLLGGYQAIDPTKAAAVTDAKSQSDLQAATTAGKFSALGKMAMFPAFTFACYLMLMLYFKSRGGYRPVQLATVESGSAGVRPAEKVGA